MAGMKLYGSAMSTNAMRVLACLYEKELDFELVAVDFAAREHKTEFFLKTLNPFGQVPAFQDGDLSIFESRAITKYLCHDYHDKGTKLIETEPRKMVTVGIWMEVEAHHFDQPSSKLGWEIVYKPMFGMVTDDAVVAEQEVELGKVLDVYETQLSSSKYLGGESFSLADLHHLPNLHVLMNCKAKELFKSRPHVSAWADDILARPAWEKVAEKFEKAKA